MNKLFLIHLCGAFYNNGFLSQFFFDKNEDAAGDRDEIRLSLPFITRLRGGHEQGNNMSITAIFKVGRRLLATALLHKYLLYSNCMQFFRIQL